MPGMPGQMPPAPGTLAPTSEGRTIDGEATPVQKFDYFQDSETAKLDSMAQEMLDQQTWAEDA